MNKNYTIGGIVFDIVNEKLYHCYGYNSDIQKYILCSMGCYFDATEDDLIFGKANIEQHLNAKIDTLNELLKEQKKEMKTPFNKGLLMAKQNGLEEEIYELQTKISNDIMYIEDEEKLNSLLIAKKQELETLRMKFSPDAYKKMLSSFIEKNSVSLNRYKLALKELKKLSDNTIAKKEPITMDNEIVIELVKEVKNDEIRYFFANYKDVENALQFDSLSTFGVYNGEPCAVINQPDMVDYGDYNFDDEYECDWRQEPNYSRIFYSPINGKKFVFDILTVDDISLQYKEYSDVMEKYKNRKRFSASEKKEIEVAKYNYEGLIANRKYLPILDDLIDFA